jgi:hypothetical protein
MLVATIADARRFVSKEASSEEWSIPESVQTCVVPIRQPDVSCTSRHSPSEFSVVPASRLGSCSPLGSESPFPSAFSLVPASMLVSTAQVLEDVRFTSCSPRCRTGRLQFKATVPAVLHALLFYPILKVLPNVTVNAFFQDTHWPGLTLRLDGAPEDRSIAAGDDIKLYYTADTSNTPLPKYAFLIVLHEGRRNQKTFTCSVDHLRC